MPNAVPICSILTKGGMQAKLLTPAMVMKIPSHKSGKIVIYWGQFSEQLGKIAQDKNPENKKRL